MVNEPSFWNQKRILITGYTGFKGAWLTFWLKEMGANVCGIALEPATNPCLSSLLNFQKYGKFIVGDINNSFLLDGLFQSERPEIVIHMAAQAQVRPSYDDPIETFHTNVTGTVSVLNAVRKCEATRCVVMVTSDKVYENREWEWGYRETDSLGGYDPYSASKACAEIAVGSMKKSFFGPDKHPARIVTVRAGNVIGGGDWSSDRLVPDIVRGCLGASGIVQLRHPSAIRPWQHVIEPISVYLMLARKLYQGELDAEGSWNIGPDTTDNRPVIEVAEALVKALGRGKIEKLLNEPGVHEAGLLTLDCAKLRTHFNWRPRLDFDTTIKMTAEWYYAWSKGEDIVAITRAQLQKYEGQQIENR